MIKRTVYCATPLLLFLACLISCCNRDSVKSPVNSYINLSDTVKYSGMRTCRGCHENIYQTYIKTGMGKSFDRASHTKSSADFGSRPVYDSINDFYYKPFWENDSLYFEEFRIANGDTVHKRIEKVSYIIGSGQHTNSHICNFSGYLFQAPITYYSQKHQWDFAPGFEGGYNSRFTRPIALECMSCHNGLPELEKGSVNKYNNVMSGIDCERCHGPGAEHVRQKQSGALVDTSKFIDYSIVNPKKLSRDLQMSLCQRCHLQGLAVLRKGKDFDDFKPSMHLSDVWDVFLPETKESRDKFIMASQAERLRMSRCYNSSEMSCITCHNPHISVKETPVEVFNNKCQSCHREKNTCTMEMAIRTQQKDNCTGCHMPKSGSIDIPHVSITDHFIRKDFSHTVSDSTEVDKVKQYLRLKCFTRENPGASALAKAYLSFYEKFSKRQYLLDSAATYLFGQSESPMPEEIIHYYFLKQDYNNLVAAANRLDKDSVFDPWTFYRVGEAHYALGNFVPASQYFSSACAMEPLNMEFQNKLGASLTQLGKYAEAKTVFKSILREQPQIEQAWSNLGFLLMREGDFKNAEEYFNRAIALNPDYEQALLNQAALYMNTHRIDKARKLAMRIIMINPQNEQANMLLQKRSK